MASETPLDSLNGLQQLRLATAVLKNEPNSSASHFDANAPSDLLGLEDLNDTNNNNPTTNVGNKEFKRRLFRPIRFSIDKHASAADAPALETKMEQPSHIFRTFNSDLPFNPLRSRRFSLRIPPSFGTSSGFNIRTRKLEEKFDGTPDFALANDNEDEDYEQLTDLMIAAKNNQLETLEELLKKKQDDINATDKFGWTALMFACYYGYSMIVKRLLLEGAQAEVYDDYHMSSLHWAAGRGHLDCVCMLIRYGKAKVNEEDRFGSSALIWACRKGFTEVAAILLKAGANIDSLGMLGWSPVLVSVLNDHIETLRLLLQYKPNVNTCDAHRLTPLIAASREGKVEIVKMLLKARAFVNLSDECGHTALIHAVKGSHLEVVDVLLRHHADIDHAGSDKKTALFWAVEKGNLSVVERLLLSKPNLESVSKDGETCLLRAVKLRKNGIVRVLLAHGAKASTTDRAGDTVLHIAVKMRSATLAQLILDNPKNQNLLQRQNKAKKTPIMLDGENSTAVFPLLTRISSKV